MNLRVLSLAALSLVIPMSAALANPLAGSNGFVPRVPVSAFAQPASWLDPSRLGVTASFSVGSGFGTGTNALQVTTLSYRFNAPVWMSVSLGNSFGSSSPRGNSFFLQGLEAAYRPFPSLQIHVQYQNVRSPLQYQSGAGFSPWSP